MLFVVDKKESKRKNSCPAIKLHTNLGSGDCNYSRISFLYTFLFSFIYFDFIHALFRCLLDTEKYSESVVFPISENHGKLYFMMMKAEEPLLPVSFPGPLNHRSADVNHTHKNDSNNAPWNMFFLLPCMHKTFTDVNDTSPSYHLAKTTGVTSAYIYCLKIDSTITNQACAYAFFILLIWYGINLEYRLKVKVDSSNVRHLICSYRTDRWVYYVTWF